jgi:hypothetical protein
MASYALYTYETQSWLRHHPEATSDEIEQAFKRIARRLGL